MRYPWCNFWKHPILVVLVAINYFLRKYGLMPNILFWADMELLRKTGYIFTTKGNK